MLLLVLASWQVGCHVARHADADCIVSLVTGHVLSIQIIRVVGNVATVEIRVTP